MSSKRTTDEIEKILFLRSEFEDGELSEYMSDDLTMIRWLKQNNYDVDIAAVAIRNHLVYRKLLNLDQDDTAAFHSNQFLCRTLPICWLGTSDKEGSPIMLRLAGKVDIEGCLNTVKTSAFVSHEMCECEKRMRFLRKKSQDLDKIVGICMIVDLEGLKFDPSNIALITSYFKPLEEFINTQNFPSIEETIIVINAPKVIASLYSILRSFWPSVINVHIFNHEYQAQLLNLIEADQLPEQYGGTLKPENLENEIKDPEKVPIDAYYSSESDPPDSFPMQIRARRKIRLELADVPKGSQMSWFFKGDHDIGFGIFHSQDNLDENPNEEMVVPKFRCKTDIVPETGEYHCEVPGKYIIEFCNGHSRMMWKNLSVSVIVRDTEGAQILWSQKELPSYV